MPIVDPWEHDKKQSIEETNELSQLLSSILSRTVKYAPSYTQRWKTCFFMDKCPSISIEDYLNRLVKYARLSETELIGILIIIDRYLTHPNQRRTHQSLNSLNAHTLIGAAMVLAQKNFSDTSYSMSYYAEVTAISKAHLVSLEKNLFSAIDRHLFTTANDFLHYKQILINEARQLEAIPGSRPFHIHITPEELSFYNTQFSSPSQASSSTAEKIENEASQSNEAKPKTEKPLISSQEPSSTMTQAGYSPRFLAKSDNTCKEVQPNEREVMTPSI